MKDLTRESLLCKVFRLYPYGQFHPLPQPAKKLHLHSFHRRYFEVSVKLTFRLFTEAVMVIVPGFGGKV